MEEREWRNHFSFKKNKRKKLKEMNLQTIAI